MNYRQRCTAVGSAALALIVALLVAAMPAAVAPVSTHDTLAAPAAAAGAPRLYSLDDFDDRVRVGAADLPRPPNDWFGAQGRWESGGARVSNSLACSSLYDCALQLDYDVSAPGAAGGYWENLAHSYQDDWPLRDLGDFEQLRFRLRGDPGVGYSDHLSIEFIGRHWDERVTYPVTGITGAWQWYTIIIRETGTIDWAHVKHVALNLTGDHLTQKVGRLYLDDISFVDLDPEDDLLELVERQTFLYFWENRHPATGFVRDRAVDPFYGRDVTSVAAIGFELAAFAIGAEHGWAPRPGATQATLQVLDKLASLPQGPATEGVSGYQGFFYHLLNIETGLRAPDSEVSTIDTTLLMAGVLLARQYFDGDSAEEAAIRAAAGQLYDRVAWDWILRRDPQPADRWNQLYMAWKPEYHDCQASGYQNCYEIPDRASGQGYFSGEQLAGSPPVARPTTWDYYTDELLLINLLALGSATHPVPVETWSAWKRETGGYGGHVLVQTWYGQLFAHLIGQVWLDLRETRERMPPHVSWWRNSGQAALANRQFAIDHAGQCTTYSPESWGLSASLGGPDDPYTSAMDGVGVYRGYGALPRADPKPPLHDCTVAPYAAIGSLVFFDADPAQNPAYAALAHWYSAEPLLWGLYGFRDAFSVQEGWYAHDCIGIDQGMILLALENYRTRLVWNLLRRDPVLLRAMPLVLEHRTCLPLFQKGP